MGSALGSVTSGWLHHPGDNCTQSPSGTWSWAAWTPIPSVTLHQTFPPRPGASSAAPAPGDHCALWATSTRMSSQLAPACPLPLSTGFPLSLCPLPLSPSSLSVPLVPAHPYLTAARGHSALVVATKTVRSLCDASRVGVDG
jgi:hypothetical protein